MPSVDVGGGIVATVDMAGKAPMVRFAGVPGQGETQAARADALLYADLHDKDFQLLPAANEGKPHRLTRDQVSDIARVLVSDPEMTRRGHFRVTWIGANQTGST